MWMTIWRACGQETVVESTSPEVQPVFEQSRSIKKLEQENPLIEATLLLYTIEIPAGRLVALTGRVLVQREEVTEKVIAEILPPRVTDWV